MDISKMYSCGMAVLLTLSISACRKNNREKENCSLVPQALMLPSVQFKVVDKNTDADLFFSRTPVYALTDIKLLFKNSAGKLDSLTPPHVDGAGDSAHFIYNIVSNDKLTDTSYLQIRGLKTDTLISTIAQVAGPCYTYSIITKVQVNKNAPGAVSGNSVLTIRK